MHKWHIVVWKNPEGKCEKDEEKFNSLWKNFKNKGKSRKNLLTHQGAYNIIIQCDVVRKYLAKAPEKVFYIIDNYS